MQSSLSINQPITKHLIFINKILRDGIGDLGHLVDIANLEAIKRNFPDHDIKGNPVDYQPIYIIILDHPNAERVSTLLRKLKAKKIITDNNNPFDINNDIRNYLKFVLDQNPHLYLAASRENNRREGSHKDDMRMPYDDPTQIRFDDTFDASALFLISAIDSEVTQVRNYCRHQSVLSCTQIYEHGKNLGKQGYYIQHYSIMCIPWGFILVVQACY